MLVTCLNPGASFLLATLVPPLVDGVEFGDEDVDGWLSFYVAGGLAELVVLGDIGDGMGEDLGQAVMFSTLQLSGPTERLRAVAARTKELLASRTTTIIRLAHALLRVGELTFDQAKEAIVNAPPPPPIAEETGP